MKKGVMLTSRDIEIMQDLYDSMLLSFGQIHERHFKNCAISTVSNRLSKLIRDELVKSIRVGIIIFRGTPETIGSVYQVTRKGIKVLEQRFPYTRFRETSPIISHLTLTHDLILADVIKSLKLQNPEGKVIQGKNFYRADAKGKRLPDAIILYPNTKQKVAIELELTAKSEKRYKDIVMQYRMQPEFEKVIYIVQRPGIAEKILEQVEGHRLVPGLFVRKPSKFSFLFLDQFLKGNSAELFKDTFNQTLAS